MRGRIHARPLTCPHGHHLTDGWLTLADDTYLCRHASVANPRRDCSTLVYVLGNNSRLGLLDVYEVDHRDMEQLKAVTDPLEVLAYLGARRLCRTTRIPDNEIS